MEAAGGDIKSLSECRTNEIENEKEIKTDRKRKRGREISELIPPGAFGLYANN